MRNKKKFMVALGMVMVLPFFAFTAALAEQVEEVENGATGTGRMREVRMQAQAGTAQEGQDMAGERMQKTREQRIMAVKALVQAQIRRAENILARMDHLITRIESRRAKLSDEGADLTAVDALISKAKEQKADAKEALDKAKANYAEIDGSEHPREQVHAFMTSMRELKTQLVALHKTLVETIRAMVKAVPHPDDDTQEENEDSAEDNNN
jgi:hypothetical protein